MNKGQSGVCVVTDTGLSNVPSTGAAFVFFNLPSPAAAKSRATPLTPKQSPRFGVTLTSKTTSGFKASTSGVPAGASPLKSMIPV